MDTITTVKLKEDGWLVNGIWNVPDDPDNRHYQLVQDWLASNTPDPEFTQEEIDAQAALAALDAEIAADTASAKIDPDILALIGARPAGIENYINTNVTDLASAKEVLIILAKVVSVLGRRAIEVD
jgi:hypothetical protein